MAGKNRIKQKESKKQRKEREQKHPSGQSKYGRKRAFLVEHGGFGFQWEDKPWKN